MVNRLHVGLHKQIELPKGSFLHISDEEIVHPKGKIFDVRRHSFNVLKDIDYLKACSIVDAVMAAFPGGENTLTKEGVPLVLLDVLLDNPKSLDRLLTEKSKDTSYISAQRMLGRIMKSPVLKSVLCGGGDAFHFEGHNRKVFARINRAELGEFDSLVLGLFLMVHYKGPQFVIPDLGFYGRDPHVRLIREGRLIGGCTFLSELPVKLRQHALLIKDKMLSGVSFEDAVELAPYLCRFPKGTNEYNSFIEEAMK